MRFNAPPVPGSRVERFNKSIRDIDCQFVNEDADARQKARKRAGHASPSTAEAGEALCSELRDQQTAKWCSLSAAECKRRISSSSNNCSSSRHLGSR